MSDILVWYITVCESGAALGDTFVTNATIRYVGRIMYNYYITDLASSVVVAMQVAVEASQSLQATTPQNRAASDGIHHQPGAGASAPDRAAAAAAVPPPR